MEQELEQEEVLIMKAVVHCISRNYYNSSSSSSPQLLMLAIYILMLLLLLLLLRLSSLHVLQSNPSSDCVIQVTASCICTVLKASCIMAFSQRQMEEKLIY